jgi:hypothetical protein
MKKKLYYTIDFELDGGMVAGSKFVYVYEITNNVPTNLTTIECAVEDNSQEKIQEYLDDNGYGDNAYEFIQL